MLRSIIGSNFQKHGSMFPLTNSEIAWRPLNAIILKDSCLLVNKWTLRTTKLKKNICKTFYHLKWKKFRKKSQKSTHLLRCTKCMSHVGYWYITVHFIFFQPPYLHKMVCFLNSWKQIVRTIVRLNAWLIELSSGRNNWFNTCARKEILSKQNTVALFLWLSIFHFQRK